MPAVETTPARLLPTIWELPDDLWMEIVPIVDRFYPPAVTGRPRADLRLVLDGIIHRLRSGCQWHYLPERFGAPSTVHGWFQRFAADGLLEEIWAYLVRECEELGGVHWEWQAADGVMGKSRFEGGARGPNPTDRAKMGTKKSIIVDEHGGPLGAVIAGANVHDTKLLADTIDAVVIARPDPERVVQNLCLDKGYDNPTGRTACAAAGYLAHIRRIGEEKLNDWGLKTPPRPSLGRRAHDRLATTLPLATHPLRQEPHQLPRTHPTRLRTALVPPTPPTQTRLTSFRTVT